MEGSSHGVYIKVLFQHLLGWTEENHKNLYLEQELMWLWRRVQHFQAQEQGKGMWTSSAELTATTDISCAKLFISSSSRTLTAGRVGFVGARRIAISMWPTSRSVMEWSPVMRRNCVCRSALTSSTVCIFGPTWWQNHASSVFMHREKGLNYWQNLSIRNSPASHPALCMAWRACCNTCSYSWLQLSKGWCWSAMLVMVWQSHCCSRNSSLWKPAARVSKLQGVAFSYQVW